jgi:integrase
LFLTNGNRGKNRDGRLETRSVLRIVREIGQRVGLHVWCHGLRHASITAAIDAAAAAGMGLHKVLAHSRHATITTLMGYYDDHDREQPQRMLSDMVARSVQPEPSESKAKATSDI